MTRGALLEVEHATRRFSNGTKAVDDVSLSVSEGEVVGLVGESGSGKSTLGRLIAGLDSPTSGTVRFRGQNLATMSKPDHKLFRREVQVIFQDSLSTLNPRMRLVDIVSEPWRIHRSIRPPGDLSERAEELLASVGLPGSLLARRAQQLSGGQRQRVNIARALACRPRLIVCDEPVSSLDVSVQAQVLESLSALAASEGTALFFISHDLSVVSHVADRVGVMYLGRVVEIGEIAAVFRQPRHPYSAALMASIPRAGPTGSEISSGDLSIFLESELPSPSDLPSGCRFRTRCWRSTATCVEVEPELQSTGTAIETSCHHPLTGGRPIAIGTKGDG